MDMDNRRLQVTIAQFALFAATKPGTRLHGKLLRDLRAIRTGCGLDILDSVYEACRVAVGSEVEVDVEAAIAELNRSVSIQIF